MSRIDIRVPDLGDAKGVSVLDVLVKKGSKVAVEDPLITLESEKASMDVPSPVSGVITSIDVKKGDEVTSGALIATLQTTDAPASPPAPALPPAPASRPAPAAAAGARTANPAPPAPV